MQSCYDLEIRFLFGVTDVHIQRDAYPGGLFTLIEIRALFSGLHTLRPQSTPSF